MKRKLTKVQKIINFVYNKGPCTWTDIQKFITGCDDAQKIYNSSMRGCGASGIWKCVVKPARGRDYFLSRIQSGGTMKYVVTDNRTSMMKLKNNRYE